MSANQHTDGPGRPLASGLAFAPLAHGTSWPAPSLIGVAQASSSVAAPVERSPIRLRTAAMKIVYRGLIALLATGWLAGATTGGTLAQNVGDPAQERQVVAGTIAPMTNETERLSSPAANEPEVASAAGGPESHPDKHRQAIARALLLLMGGGNARPFPLIPK
jgi:hypothetical protein